MRAGCAQAGHAAACAGRSSITSRCVNRSRRELGAASISAVDTGSKGRRPPAMARILAPGEDGSRSWLNSLPLWPPHTVETPVGRRLPGLTRSGMDLTLENSTAGERMVVAVGGEIDVYTAPKLRERLV